MKKIVSLVLAGALLFSTSVSVSAKTVGKNTQTVTVMRMSTDPDFPDIK